MVRYIRFGMKLMCWSFFVRLTLKLDVIFLLEKNIIL